MNKDDKNIITSIYDKDSPGAPSAVVPKDPDPEEMPQLLEFLASETGLVWGALDQAELDKFAPVGQTWQWQEYQVEYLDCNTNYISNKARQVGLSAAFAAKAFARGILTEGSNYNAIFVSHKRDEAINKVRYVKQFLSALPPRFRKRLVRDPQQLIEWENADGTRVKIISHAQRPIRGDNGDVFLDELAFYQFAELIYESAFAATGIVGGTLDVTSTPFGKFGKFFEIVDNPKKYPDFFRRWIYWWNCTRYLKDPPPGMSPEAFFAFIAAEAPTLGFTDEATEERVYKYGNDTIQKMFRNSSDVTSFRQEFEGHFVDEEASFFSQDLILRCMYPDESSHVDDYDPIEDDFDVPIEEALAEEKWPMVERYSNVNFRVYNTLEELYAAVTRGDVSYNLVAGVDLGTTNNSTEFIILEEIQFSNGKTLQVERFHMSKFDWPLPEQQAYFSRVLRDGFIQRMRMDNTGLGVQMGQYLSSVYPDIFIPVHMGGRSNMQETEMMNLKARMDNMGLAMSYDKNKVTQLHSIRRVVSASKAVSYRATKEGRHNADYAWALAFASLAGTPFGKSAHDYDLGSIDDLAIAVKNDLKLQRGFVDKFEKDFLGDGVSNLGSSLGLGLGLGLNDMIPTEFNPGSFIKDWDS